MAPFFLEIWVKYERKSNAEIILHMACVDNDSINDVNS